MKGNQNGVGLILADEIPIDSGCFGKCHVVMTTLADLVGKGLAFGNCIVSCPLVMLGFCFFQQPEYSDN